MLCPLILSSRRHLVFLPRLSSSSRCTTLSSSHCAGWLLLRRLSARHRLVLSSSSHCAALSPSHRVPGCFVASRRAVVLSSPCPLTAPPSRSLIVQAGWLLHRLSSRRRLVFSSRRTLVLLSSSHCAALSSSHDRAVLFLRRPLSCRCLVLTSSSHSQRHLRRPRRWRSLSPAAPDAERCRRGGPRHRITVALTIALDAVSCPPTLSP